MKKTYFTIKEMKALKSNPYTYKLTENRIWFTAAFKEMFWVRYQSGDTPRKIISDLGYDDKVLGQKRIDGIVQKIKKEALSGDGFTEGTNRTSRIPKSQMGDVTSPQTLERMQNELIYLRQEVEYLKKIIKADHSKRNS